MVLVLALGLPSQFSLRMFGCLANEYKRAKRRTALLFSSSKPKPSELQLRKESFLRRTPCPCLAQAPLPLPISLVSRISAAAPFFKRPLVGPLVSRRRAKGLERRADNLYPEYQRRMASVFSASVLNDAQSFAASTGRIYSIFFHFS